MSLTLLWKRETVGSPVRRAALSVSLPSGGGGMGVLGGLGVPLPLPHLRGVVAREKIFPPRLAGGGGRGWPTPRADRASVPPRCGRGCGCLTSGERCTAQACGGVGLAPAGGGAGSHPALLPPSAGRREFSVFSGKEEGSAKAQPRCRCCAEAVGFLGERAGGSPRSMLRRVDLGYPSSWLSGRELPPVSSRAGGKAADTPGWALEKGKKWLNCVSADLQFLVNLLEVASFSYRV